MELRTTRSRVTAAAFGLSTACSVHSDAFRAGPRASNPDDDLSGLLVTIDFKGAKVDPVWKLAAKRRIWIYGGEELRLSTHIHTRRQDLELFCRTLDEALGHKA